MTQLLRILFFLSLFSLTAAAAPWEGVFEGTVGKARVIVELHAGDEKTEFKGGFERGSRYSYLPKARDLFLGLDADGETLMFSESPTPEIFYVDMPRSDVKILARWSLKVDRKGANGTWMSSDGKKTLPITLTRLPLLADADVPEFNSVLGATYNARWFRAVKIGRAAKSQRFGSVTMAFEQDSAFKLAMPVFTRFPDKAGMAKVNAMLRQYYRQSLMANRDCINGVNEDVSDQAPDFTFTISYVTPRVLSLTEAGSVYCGGAHPNNYVKPLTFDLLTPKPIGGVEYGMDLKPDGFGSVLKLANKQERIAFENFAMERWTAGAKAAGETTADGCASTGFNVTAAPGEKALSLLFDRKGLGVMRTDYPHVSSNCLFQDFNPTVIPWKDLKPYLKEGQNLIVTEMK
jgi:hypothetical protein